MVSYGGTQKAKQNALLCHPAIFHPMPSIAYRLARVAAGDGVAAVSLYSVSPHDLVAGHALLRAVNGDIWNEKGESVRYASPQAFTRSLNFCFGGAQAACSELLGRPWHSLINGYLGDRGLSLRQGTIVDATLIHAPSSTKNQDGKRDPEMHQTKKGNQYYFGMKAHIGACRVRPGAQRGRDGSERCRRYPGRQAAAR